MATEQIAFISDYDFPDTMYVCVKVHNLDHGEMYVTKDSEMKLKVEKDSCGNDFYSIIKDEFNVRFVILYGDNTYDEFLYEKCTVVEKCDSVYDGKEYNTFLIEYKNNKNKLCNPEESRNRIIELKDRIKELEKINKLNERRKRLLEMQINTYDEFIKNENNIM